MGASGALNIRYDRYSVMHRNVYYDVSFLLLGGIAL